MEEAVNASQRKPKLTTLSFSFGLGFCVCLFGVLDCFCFFLSYVLYHACPFIYLGITYSCLTPFSFLPFVVSERHTLEQEVSKTECRDNDVLLSTKQNG